VRSATKTTANIERVRFTVKEVRSELLPLLELGFSCHWNLCFSQFVDWESLSGSIGKANLGGRRFDNSS